jgi:protein ImuA
MKLMDRPVSKTGNLDRNSDNIQISNENKHRQVARLRRQLAVSEGRAGRVRLSLGVDSLDHALAGGLALGRVHLVTGNMQRHGAVSGLAIAMIRRLCAHLCHIDARAAVGPIVWCPAGRQGGAGMLYGHGLAAVGLDPSHLLIVDAPSPARRLAALEDILRTGGLAAVILEYDGMQKSADYWMRLARRAQLASEASGVTAFLLGAPIPASGFETAWHVHPAPDLAARSNPACGGRSVWDVALQRARGGRPHACRIVWQPESGGLRAFESGWPYQAGAPAVVPVQENLPISPPPVRSAIR